jgi:hypothetical protein
MAGTDRWIAVLRYATLATLLLLVVQYLLGLWTSVYAPSSFTTNVSSDALGFHYLVGYALFLGSLAVLVCAATTRAPRLVGPSVVLLVSIVLAGVFGRMFVSSTPNNPLYSFGMGLMFLIALGSAIDLYYALRYPRSSSLLRSAGSTPSAPST